MESQKSEAATVAELVRQAITPTLCGHPNVPVAIFPNGTVKVLELEAHQPHPKRKRATVALIEVASFIAYLNAHKMSAETHVFGMANEQGGSFTAIIDYHQTTNALSKDLGGVAGWGEHTAKLTLQTTPEWRRWIENNGKPLTQEQFAEFLEDNLTDIVQPDAGSLIDVAQLLQGKKSVAFKSGKNLRNGAIQLEYSEEIQTTGGRANGDMQVPDRFVLGICPFVGAYGVEMSARLRFRISDGGKLTFIYILDRPFKVIESAFASARARIEAETGLTVHLGSATVLNPTS